MDVKLAATADAIFAANRADRRVSRRGGIARRRDAARARVHEDGSLRVRFPERRRAELEAVIVNTGGRHRGRRPRSTSTSRVGRRRAARRHHRGGREGLSRARRRAGRIGVEAAIGAAARARLAAAGDHPVRSRAALRAASMSIWPRTPRCSWPKPIVFGRSAHGRGGRAGRVHDRWRVRRDGRLIFAETVRLDGAIAATLARAGGRGRRRRDRDRSDRAGRRGASARARARSNFRGEVGAVGLERALRSCGCCAHDGAASTRAISCTVHRPRCAARCRGSGESDGTAFDESDAAREGQAADRDGRHGGAAAARTRRQAQSSRKRWR